MLLCEDLILLLSEVKFCLLEIHTCTLKNISIGKTKNDTTSLPEYAELYSEQILYSEADEDNYQ